MFTARRKLTFITIAIIAMAGLGFLGYQLHSGKILSKAAVLGVSTNFSDVGADYWAYNYIQAANLAGIVSGYPDGSFKPEQVVTRDQLAVFLARAVAGGDSKVPTGPTSASFSDIPPSHWAFKYIEYGKSKGLVGGYGDGKYHPEYEVTRDQMSVIIARVLNMNASDAPTKNIIANSSFETRSGNDFNEWVESQSVSPSSTLTADPSIKQDGEASIKFNITDTANASVRSSSIPVKGGQKYILSFYGKSSDGNHGVYFSIKDNQNYCWHTNGWDTNCSSTWPAYKFSTSLQRHNVEITPRASATSISQFTIARSGSGTYSVNLDAIQLELAPLSDFKTREYNLSAIIDGRIPAGPATSTFRDVPTDNWAFKHIEYLNSQNIIGGYPDGTFKPTDKVTRAQMCVFIGRAFDLLSTALVANVSGKVTNYADAPIANAYLVIDDGEDITQADANGNFRIEGLDSTTYEVSIYDANGNLYESPDLSAHLISPNYGNNTINFSGLQRK